MERETPEQAEHESDSKGSSLGCLTIERRPHGYWQDRKNIRAELSLIVKELGYFPKGRELKEINWALYAGIQKYYDGLKKVKRWKGFGNRKKRKVDFSESRKRFEKKRDSDGEQQSNRKPNGYWKRFDNVQKELEIEKKRLGHFPTVPELEERNRTDIISACYSYHEGYNAVRQRMGQASYRKEGAYWKSWNNVKREMRAVIDELGHFPTQRELRKMKRFDLAVALSRRHGGICAVRERMGYGIREIRNDVEFVSFVRRDPTARNLAATALSLNGEAHDIEQIMVGVYDGKFKDQEHLHRLLQENRDDVIQLMQEGVTNLGAYIGEFSLGDRSIIPVLLGEALSQIPADRLTVPLEEKIFRVQRAVYGPKFNDDPSTTLEEISSKIESSEGRVRGIYERLHNHYQQTLQLAEEI